MSKEIETAIAREQARLERLLERTRAGDLKAGAPGLESIPDLLEQIRAAIDQIEVAIGAERAQRGDDRPSP